jgi:hypothetical protein
MVAGSIAISIATMNCLQMEMPFTNSNRIDLHWLTGIEQEDSMLILFQIIR